MSLHVIIKSISWLVHFWKKATNRAPITRACSLIPQGDILAHYRKIHLFDIDIPGQVRVKESDTKEAWREVVASTTPLGVFGLSVCYDLRFPELYRQLAQKARK